MTGIQALKVALLTVSAMVVQTGFAQDLVAPRPLNAPQPPQPTNAAGQPVEGWVTVRYSVQADGTPVNVRVIESMPPFIDTSPSLSTFGEWTFSPGTSDGSAIDWHNNETRITFRSQGGASPTAAAFADQYAAIDELIEDGDLEEALSASKALLAENASTLADIGQALIQQAEIHRGMNDDHAALPLLRMATDPDVPMLSGVELFPAVVIRMEVEQKLGHVYEAIQSYDRIASAFGSADSNEYAEFGELFKKVWREEELSLVAGRIDDGVWRFDAHRPFFYVDQINGQISTVDMECDTRRVTLDFDPAADYQIPAAFGDCTLFLHGTDGTTFAFIEALPQAGS